MKEWKKWKTVEIQKQGYPIHFLCSLELHRAYKLIITIVIDINCLELLIGLLWVLHIMGIFPISGQWHTFYFTSVWRQVCMRYIKINRSKTWHAVVWSKYSRYGVKHYIGLYNQNLTNTEKVHVTVTINEVDSILMSNKVCSGLFSLKLLISICTLFVLTIGHAILSNLTASCL